MKKLFKWFVLVFLFCLCLPTIVAAQKKIESVMVIFSDGGKVAVRDWAFVYKFGESDSPPKGFTIYPAKTKETKNLLLERKTTERGVTFTDELSISGDKLSSIKFSKGYKDVTIKLVGGEIIKINKLEPAKILLSKKNTLLIQSFILKERGI